MGSSKRRRYLLSLAVSTKNSADYPIRVSLISDQHHETPQTRHTRRGTGVPLPVFSPRTSVLLFPGVPNKVPTQLYTLSGVIP